MKGRKMLELVLKTFDENGHKSEEYKEIVNSAQYAQRILNEIEKYINKTYSSLSNKRAGWNKTCRLED